MREGSYREYLDQHLMKQGKLSATPKSFYKPLNLENQYIDKLGRHETRAVAHAEGEAFSADVEYGEANTRDSIFTLISHGIKKIGPDDKWRKLFSITLEDKNGKKLKIGGNLFLGLEVYFNQNAKPIKLETREEAGGLIMNADALGQDTIVLKNNILSPGSMLMLLHEIGHQKIHRENGREDLLIYLRHLQYVKTLNANLLTKEEQEDPSMVEKIAARVLENERDAWAFALKQARPLIRSHAFNKNDIETFIHQQALQSYSNLFNTLINPKIMEKIKLKFFAWLNTKLNII